MSMWIRHCSTISKFSDCRKIFSGLQEKCGLISHFKKLFWGGRDMAQWWITCFAMCEVLGSIPSIVDIFKRLF